MSPLRQRMLDAMELRGYAERTRETYLHWIIELARHTHASPDRLGAADLEAFLLHLRRARGLSYSTCLLRKLVGAHHVSDFKLVNQSMGLCRAGIYAFPLAPRHRAARAAVVLGRVLPLVDVSRYCRSLPCCAHFTYRAGL